MRLLVRASTGDRSTSRAKSPASVAQAASTAAGGDAPQAPRSRSPCERPCGTARSIAVRTARRLSGRSDAVSVVFAAIMPQPRSTPTAAGMTALRVGMTLPTVEPLPTCTSGITARWRKMNGMRRCARKLLARLVLDRYTPRPHLHGRTTRDAHDLEVLVAHGNALRHCRQLLSVDQLDLTPFRELLGLGAE